MAGGMGERKDPYLLAPLAVPLHIGPDTHRRRPDTSIKTDTPGWDRGGDPG